MPPTVSLTMIVRNEEANLPGCLALSAGLFDELVIVDTGSTDRTKEIAAASVDKHGRPARVFDFEWCDDFAAARNESLRRAIGDWVFTIDADERIDERTQPQLAALLASLSGQGEIGLLWTSLNKSGRFAPGTPKVMLFSREPERHWSGRIHERIQPVIAPRIEHIWIQHLGYASADSLAEKALRNLSLLKKDIDEISGLIPPVYLFYLGLEHANLGDHETAIAHFNRCLKFASQDARPPIYYGNLCLALGKSYGAIAKWRELEMLEDGISRINERGAAALLEELRSEFPVASRSQGVSPVAPILPSP